MGAWGAADTAAPQHGSPQQANTEDRAKGTEAKLQLVAASHKVVGPPGLQMQRQHAQRMGAINQHLRAAAKNRDAEEGT